MKQELIFPKREGMQTIYSFRVTSPTETSQFARDFASQLREGDVVAFYGNLGSGKTFIIQQICKFLKTEETVTSPTFTIINEYHTPKGQIIYHFDFYRLTHEAELQNLGLEDYFYNDFICFIEWADKIESYLPIPRYEIHIRFVTGHPRARDIAVFRIDQPDV